MSTEPIAITAIWTEPWSDMVTPSTLCPSSPSVYGRYHGEIGFHYNHRPLVCRYHMGIPTIDIGVHTLRVRICIMTLFMTHYHHSILPYHVILASYIHHHQSALVVTIARYDATYRYHTHRRLIYYRANTRS